MECLAGNEYFFLNKILIYENRTLIHEHIYNVTTHRTPSLFVSLFLSHHIISPITSLWVYPNECLQNIFRENYIAITENGKTKPLLICLGWKLCCMFINFLIVKKKCNYIPLQMLKIHSKILMRNEMFSIVVHFDINWKSLNKY